MKNKKNKFFSWENIAYQPGHFTTPVFTSQSARDAAMADFRERAIDHGLSRGAAEAGIYPVTLPWSQAREALSDL